MPPDDPKPSETYGAGGQVNFGDMLKLMDKFHAADRDLERKLEDLEGRRREDVKVLHEKIEALKTEITALNEDRRNLVEERAKGIDERLDALADKATALLKDVEYLKGSDEFAEVPWYFKPAWVKAFGMAIAAVITAVVAAVLLFWEKAPVETPEKSPAPHTAPAEPGDSGPTD